MMRKLLLALANRIKAAKNINEIITVRVVYLPPSANSLAISDLNKQATQLKKTDIDQAIVCLRKANALLGGDTIYPIATWLRLPLFLQQAGYFDEAMQEFETLLAEARARRTKECSHCTLNSIEAGINADYAHIYDKMRLACKRQKLKAEEGEYAALSENHWRLFAEFRKLADKELSAKLYK